MTTPKVEVRALSRFQRDVKHLAKKYRHLRNDLDAFVERLRQGETPGDQIPRIGYTVYKARVTNTDAQRGKQGGYRVIYYVKMPTLLLLITIYAKTEQSDIEPDEIRRIIEKEGDLEDS
ncbi:MAG: type II toxin-antitoxin system RelE/ParE family toxin [Anaerolineae bacterium]|nr:type II toxin-antitoxin system RelE/ParE family toxin [Anaerolineae bacterium]